MFNNLPLPEKKKKNDPVAAFTSFHVVNTHSVGKCQAAKGEPQTKPKAALQRTL